MQRTHIDDHTDTHAYIDRAGEEERGRTGRKKEKESLEREDDGLPWVQRRQTGGEVRTQ